MEALAPDSSFKGRSEVEARSIAAPNKPALNSPAEFKKHALQPGRGEVCEQPESLVQRGNQNTVLARFFLRLRPFKFLEQLE